MIERINITTGEVAEYPSVEVAAQANFVTAEYVLAKLKNGDTDHGDDADYAWQRAEV
jgi:hypothetical protein